MKVKDATQLEELPRRPGGARILRPKEAAAWRDGFEFLASARKDAKRTRDEANRGYASEYAQGYEEGRTAGAAEAAQLVSETAVKVDQYLGMLEQEVTALALDIVRRVLGDFDVAELVARAAARAVADMRRAKYFRIRVHPDAALAVQSKLDALLAGSQVGFTLEIRPDRTLRPAACIVTTDAAVVDTSLDSQLKAIAAAIADKARPQ
ncbi:type III secretion system stator protein SctL [Aquamicrobium sp. LC103]|uniref:type III secretion system stator protein SctL n=1 Tax=Aquamicrobium sp. LC103 TaxID=1120658 RepID=UPI00063E992F|nr:type III secretion system stator protein SctL [Aquamicrobium sp. LC103]TKT69264.1 HrpE/YscL family type III secretion apparatus protein [Aquamicrobium sp. LC103]